MKLEHLNKIKSVYDALMAGISNPVKINEAYGYLPNYVENSPMIAKIRAINRFMMLSYHDELKVVDKEVQEEVTDAQVYEALTESIGTVENLPKQSHVEDNDIQEFLTKEEKQTLSSKKAGTEFKRTRSPNGTRKPRK